MSTRYSAYPEYTLIDDHWVKCIPKNWKCLGFGKAMNHIRNGCSSSQIEKTSSTVKVTRIESISTGYINESKVGYVANNEALRQHLLIRGDIQLSNINSLSMIGNCALFDGINEIYAGMNLLHIRPNINVVVPAFALYQLKAKHFRNQIEANAKPAINQASIPVSTLKQLSFLLPTKNEQMQIASFLNHETAKIDRLIEKQKRLIELLKEKRQAVISHAVTKGLNPDAPMRDSGVEWLGEVPAHWITTKAKYLFDFVTSGSRGWAEYYSDNGSLFFRIANLTRDTIEPKLASVQNVTPPHGSEGERAKIIKGDLLISITADLGSVCVADCDVSGGYVSQHVSLCRPNKNVVSANWLGYFVLSDMAKEQFLGSAYGGTKIQLSLEDIRDLWVVNPGAEEQAQIAEYIRSQLLKYIDLIEAADKQINLLKERRTALISAAVTGKIDVRDWQPPAGKHEQGEGAA